MMAQWYHSDKYICTAQLFDVGFDSHISLECEKYLSAHIWYELDK